MTNQMSLTPMIQSMQINIFLYETLICNLYLIYAILYSNKILNAMMDSDTN